METNACTFPVSGNLVDVKPWKNRHYYAIILVIVVLLIFMLFSPIG